MSLQPSELADPDAVDAYLLAQLTVDITDEAVADARSVAEAALAQPAPPAGAHVVLARLAELDGDLAGFADHTSLALAADPAFGPALEDREYLSALRAGAGRRASAARRAEHLFHKADRWGGRVPQLPDTVTLARRVLGVDDPWEHPLTLTLVSRWQFLGFLLFEAGLVARFEADCARFLPAAERTILASWHDVRHRLVRLEWQRGRRGRFTDLVTGEIVEATVLHDEGLWVPGRHGLALLVPAGDGPVLVGEPVLVNDETSAILAASLGDADPLLVAQLCLDLCLVGILDSVMTAQDERVRFALPGVDPDELDYSEAGVLDAVRRARPAEATAADAGDELSEADLLLDAIVAHRIISLRVPETWDLAQRLLAAGWARADVWRRLRDVTAGRLAARVRDAA